MSVTITAMSIPQVAYGPWEKIDRYLAEPEGDWPLVFRHSLTPKASEGR